MYDKVIHYDDDDDNDEEMTSFSNRVSSFPLLGLLQPVTERFSGQPIAGRHAAPGGRRRRRRRRRPLLELLHVGGVDVDDRITVRNDAVVLRARRVDEHQRVEEHKDRGDRVHSQAEPDGVAGVDDVSAKFYESDTNDVVRSSASVYLQTASDQKCNDYRLVN